MHEDITQLDLHALYDLLAVYTTKYTQMLRYPAPTPDFKDCEHAIVKLQTEIDFRNAREARSRESDFEGDGEPVPVLI